MYLIFRQDYKICSIRLSEKGLRNKLTHSYFTLKETKINVNS